VKSDTISFYKGGRYYIRLTTIAAITGCMVSFIDTLDIQEPKYDLINLKDTFHCEGDSVHLKADILPAWGLSSVRWHTLEPNDTNTNVHIKINKPVAEIRITAKDSQGCTLTDFVRVYKYSAPTVSLGNDLTLCGAYQHVLKPAVSGSFPGIPLYYRWQDFSTADSFIASGNGWHHVEVSNVCGLKVDSMFIYDRYNLLKPTADRHFCEGKSITLTAQLGGLKYRWNNVNFDSTLSISVGQAGLYQCKMILTCGDTLIEKFTVIEEQKPQLNLPQLATYCIGDSVSIIPGIWDIFTKIEWNDLNSDSQRYFKSPGNYVFSASNVCGVFKDSIEIREIGLPMVSLGSDTLYCGNVNHGLQMSDTSYAYLWNDSTTGISNRFNQPGVYWVRARGVCGDTYDTLKILQSFIPKVALGNDTLVAAPFSLKLDAGNVGAQRIWSTTDTTQTITVNNFGRYWVQASTPCGTSTDTIEIRDVLSIHLLGSDDFKIYPNPTRGILNIQTKGRSIDYLEVMDHLGKSCLQSHHPLRIEDVYKLELMDVPSGLYFLSIEFSDGQKVNFPISLIK
jgi:hypothetical protein